MNVIYYDLDTRQFSVIDESREFTKLGDRRRERAITGKYDRLRRRGVSHDDAIKILNRNNKKRSVALHVVNAFDSGLGLVNAHKFNKFGKAISMPGRDRAKVIGTGVGINLALHGGAAALIHRNTKKRQAIINALDKSKGASTK